MDQLRDSLSDVVAQTSEQVTEAVNTVADSVVSMADAASEQGTAPAEAVHVEVVEPEKDEA